MADRGRPATAAERMRRMRQMTRFAHADQTRNAGRVPYWVHTDAVADICRNALAVSGERTVLGDEAADDLVLAAYGHDLYEDTAIRPGAVRYEFGSRVDGWIQDLTNAAGDDDRAAYLAHVRDMSDEARVIKCADLIDNTLSVAYGVHDLGLAWVRDFFLPIAAETRQALHSAPFQRLPATGAHLLGLVDWAWMRLVGSIETATGRAYANDEPTPEERARQAAEAELAEALRPIDPQQWAQSVAEVKSREAQRRQRLFGDRAPFAIPDVDTDS